MKNLYLLALLGGLAFFFSPPVFSQNHQQSQISAGIILGGLHPYGRITRSFLTEQGRSTFSSAPGLDKPILGVGAQIRLESPLSRQFIVGGNLYWVSSNDPLNEEDFPVMADISELIISSTQYYSMVGFDGTITYQLFPKAPVEFRLGTGIAIAYRLYKYRDQFTYQITGQQAALIRENYAIEDAVILGLPLIAQIRLPITTHTTIGLHSSYRRYLNYDRQFTVSFELGYNF